MGVINHWKDYTVCTFFRIPFHHFLSHLVCPLTYPGMSPSKTLVPVHSKLYNLGNRWKCNLFYRLWHCRGLQYESESESEMDSLGLTSQHFQYVIFMDSIHRLVPTEKPHEIRRVDEKILLCIYERIIRDIAVMTFSWPTKWGLIHNTNYLSRSWASTHWLATILPCEGRTPYELLGVAKFTPVKFLCVTKLMHIFPWDFQQLQVLQLRLFEKIVKYL